MTTPVGAVRARLTRAGHLPAVLVDGVRVLAPLLGGRAARLTVGPPVDDVLAAALDQGARPAAAAGAGGRSVATPLAPPGRLGSPAGDGLPSRTSSSAAWSAGSASASGGSGALVTAGGSAGSPPPGSLWSAGPAPATGAGPTPRTADPRAGRADAPATAAKGGPTPPSDGPKAAVTTSDAGAAGAAGAAGVHDPASASRPPRPGERPPASAPVALGFSPAARGGSRLAVAPDGPGRQGPGGPGPLPGDGMGDGQRRSAPTGRRRTPPRDGEPRPLSAPERDAGTFDSRPVPPTAPRVDRASGGTGLVPPGSAAIGPGANGAPPPPAPVAGPQGLAALAAWWEEQDGVERGELPVASRLLDASPPARRAPSRVVAGEAGEIDDGALLALDRFSAALEQVLISEAASHGIEVQR